MSTQAAPLVKKFIIEVDMVNGTVDYENPDNLTYLQVCGMMEYARLMIAKEFLRETNDD